MEELIKIAGTIVQAIAVAVTAIFASIGLNAWRRQLIGKRQIEIAEEVLVAAYKARANLAAVRSPGAFVGEGQSRPKDPSEEGDLGRLRNAHFVPLERMQKLTDDFAHFEKTKILAQVHFDPQVSKSLGEIIGAYNSVAFAARMLVSQGYQTPLKLTERWEATIWDRGEEDEIRRSVDAAVRQIEDVCRPILKG